MKIWKILVFAPYALIVGWILISYETIATGNIGGIFLGAAFLTLGIAMTIIYTIALGAALLIRWIILRRRRV
jgi:hypothetical protein